MFAYKANTFIAALSKSINFLSNELYPYLLLSFPNIIDLWNKANSFIGLLLNNPLTFNIESFPLNLSKSMPLISFRHTS
jgi:hypothetical protein